MGGGRGVAEVARAPVLHAVERVAGQARLRQDLARLDRQRKRKAANKEWLNPHDPDAKVTKMKDGQTQLAHKAEHAVEQVKGAQAGVAVPQPLEEIIADKGYHSNQTMVDLAAAPIRSYIARAGPGSTRLVNNTPGAGARVPQPSTDSWPARAGPTDRSTPVPRPPNTASMHPPDIPGKRAPASTFIVSTSTTATCTTGG